MEKSSTLPVIIFLVPLFGSFAVYIFGRKSYQIRAILSIIIVLLTLLLVIFLTSFALEGTILENKLIHIIPNIWFYFRVDALGSIFTLTAAILWSLSTLHSYYYIQGQPDNLRYYFFLLLCFSWSLGIGLSGNLFTLFIFYELFSISTYPLIIQEETKEAFRAGLKYIIYILLGGSLIIFSVVFCYSLVNFMLFNMVGILHSIDNILYLKILFWTFIIGFGVKAAIMPLHGWVPDAHPVAPSPFSAILSGIMVVAGAFGILRVIYNIFGPEIIPSLDVQPILGTLASITIILSSIMAIEQDNLKRRLAYSTIGQMSYIVLGAIILTPQATWGAMVHIINHATMKGTLFLCAGNIIKETGIKNVSQMRGIGKQLPLTMSAFTIAALGMIGSPPFAGFISKWYLCLGAISDGKFIYALVYLLSSLLGAIYFLPIIYTAFFQKDDKNDLKEKRPVLQNSISKIETHWTMLVPVIVGSLLIIILGIAEGPFQPILLSKIMTRIIFFGGN